MSDASTLQIDVSTAIDKALEFARKTLGKKENVSDFRLEEVDFLEDNGGWSVTLSFLRPVTPVELDLTTHEKWERMLSGKRRDFYRREYKSFVVDSTTGEVQSMKIRSPV